MNGNLFLEVDGATEAASQYYFVLIGDQLCCMELPTELGSGLEEDDDVMDGHEDYWGEVWYHPKCLSRDAAVEILRKKKIHGSFLVRPRGDESSWALSYWCVAFLLRIVFLFLP